MRNVNKDAKYIILHVEDNFEYLELTKFLIQKDLPFCEIEGARSTEEALRKIGMIHGSKYALVILDYEFNTGQNGIDFMKKLTAINNLIPVLFLSCHDDKYVIDTAMKLGARDFLHKYNSDHLAILTDKIQAILLSGNTDNIAPTEI